MMKKHTLRHPALKISALTALLLSVSAAHAAPASNVTQVTLR